MDEKIILTDHGKKVLTFMQSHTDLTVGKDIGAATGVGGIYAVLNSLINRGLVQKGEPISRDFTNAKGETQLKEYQTYLLTEKGADYIVNF